MKKILNIALGDMSTGELGISIEFTKNQSPEKYCNYFLIPQEKENIMPKSKKNVFFLTKNNTPVKNRAIAKKLIEEIKPDLIVLFDIYTFEYAQSWTGCNTAFLKMYNIPLASIDEYEYTLTNYKIDYYGLFVKKLPPLFQKCDYILKNCPFNMPKHLEDEKKCMYYRVFEKFQRISSEDRRYYRKKYFEIDDDTKIIFFPTSFWEVSGAYSFECQNSLMKWLGPIVYNYLSELDSEIVLAHIGSENWNIQSIGKVKYLHIDCLNSEEFEKVLQASDVFLTYNIVSISLSKAIFYGIPSLVLNNSKIIEFRKLENALKKKTEWYQIMANEVGKVYPFSASLFGWNNFLRESIRENAYIKVFDTVNVFNFNKALESFKKVIFDECYRNDFNKKRNDFIEQYEKINSSEKTLDIIFGNDDDTFSDKVYN